jgi:hypothetical protein
MVVGGKPILVAIGPGWLLQMKGLETLPPIPTRVVI